MTNKDFLSQFSGDNKKPDSFKEEERVKVSKDKKPVNIKALIIIAASVLVVVGVVLFIIFRPTIEVRNFVGLDVNEAKAWIKQNEIETQGIIFREEYSFDYDEGYIVSQSIEEGKKVRKDVKMDFVVSNGADPDELISVPDIESMNKEEIQQWIKENKLQKTKITSSYNEDVPTGEVVSFEFKGVEPDSFTRSSVLNITVSKGPQPAGTVTVEDFVKQDFSVVEAWGKKHKVEIIKTTKYDNKVLKDIVISQSIEAKKTIKEGESLTVVVSLGKGVVVPDFAKMTNTEVDDWLKENASFVKVKEMYSTESGYIIEQSIPTGKYIGEDSKLNVTKNLGSHFYIDEIGFSIEGNSYDKFKDFAESLEEKGIYIDTHKNFVPSDKPERTILSIMEIYDDDGNKYSTAERLPLEVHVRCNISNGNLANKIRLPYEKYIGEPYSELKQWLIDNHSSGIECVTAVSDETKKVLSIKINGSGKDIKDVDGYLDNNTKIEVTTES